MRQVTATEKYRAVNEGKMAKGEFVRQMRMAYPSVISQFNGYNDTVQILKNKGLVFETHEEQHNLSDDAVRRGMDVEIAVLGHDPADCKDKEVQEKAKAKAIANLKKDPLHYINLIARESSKVDKHDKYQEVKNNNHKDTFNDMKKANLKEGMYIDDEEWEKEMGRTPEDTEKAINKEKSKLSEDNKETVLDLLSHLKKAKGVDTEVVKDFLKTHWNDIRADVVSGKMDLQAIEDEFEEFLSVNYEAPSDFMQQEVGGVDKYGHKKEDDDEVSTLSKAKETIWSMKEAFKPGDMWSKNFDYKGMLKFALSVDAGTPKEVLQALSDSFEDVNYHSENAHLQDAIEALESGDQDQFVQNIESFKDAVTQTIKGIVAERGGFERKQVEEDVDEGFNDQLSAEDLADLAQFFYGYAIRTEMDEYTEVADHIDQAARKLAEIEAPDRGPGMEEEKASKDYDKDGKIEDEEEEYKGVKDRAIKSAMGQQGQLKEAVKAIIEKVLSEEMINEAATAELARIGEDYGDFEGMKAAINQLENIVTEIESFYDKTRAKIQKVYDSLGELRNEEGLKVGGFLAPAIEQAFIKDLRPVTKIGFTKGLDQPKVRILTQKDIDMHNSGERPLGETEIEAPKQTMFTPVNEKK